jgi:ABC-type amino acid transport substrate-binding protein
MRRFCFNAAALLVLIFLTPFPAYAETAYDRVIKSGTIRCGFITYPPMLARDPNTGAMSGIVADLMTEVGVLLDLKIEWAEEVGFDTSIEGLKAGRYDMICTGFWRNVLESKHVFYTIPYLYSRTGIFVRADDGRFDSDIATMNDPAIRIVTKDGQITGAIAQRDFPKATIVELPNLTSSADLLENIASGKADATFVEAGAGLDYIKANPGKIKSIHDATPLRIYQNTLALPFGASEFKSMIDTALIEIVDNGGMDKIVQKYDPEGKIFLPVAKPYQTPAQ